MSFEHPNRNNESMRDVELDIMSRPPEHNTTNLDLDRMNLMLDILGHPEQSFRVIHITGTNGKGSVAHIIASVLQQAGYRTGLFTSPHLQDFRERIRMDGRTSSVNILMASFNMVALLIMALKGILEHAPRSSQPFFNPNRIELLLALT